MNVYTESDRGKKRARNEDYVLTFEINDIIGLVIADGLGGHSVGHVASRVAATTFEETFQELSPSTINKETVSACFGEAETAVHQKMEENSKYEEMGSTLTTAIIHDETALIGNVGDSRAYLLTQNEATQISEDHIKQTNSGIGGHFGTTSYLYNVIGGRDSDIEVDVFEVDISPNDILLLCTDGLTDELGDSRIQKIVSNADSVHDAGENLVRYANRSGGRDNITVALYSPEME
jgi:serine/threonine protein phosphatase PrpC